MSSLRENWIIGLCLGSLLVTGFYVHNVKANDRPGSCEAADDVCNRQLVYDEHYRLQYHFSPEQNWINDPCGLIYYEGEYHHFHQYNPFGDQWGNMHWGHAVSTDLVHWQPLPIAIPEENGVMIFTGSSVYDVNNTSGFGQPDNQALVAIYTGFLPNEGNIQDQRVAYSSDNARTFTKYPGNPVLDIGSTEFRDPMVFWYEPDSEWKMVITLSVDHLIRIYGSPDLLQWTGLSDFQGGEPGRIWECPNMFRLPIDEDIQNQKWVMQVSVNGFDAVPKQDYGIQYFIGEFNGTHFINDNPFDTRLWVEQARDFYAPHSWANIPQADGRRIWIGWFNYPDYASAMPVSPWRGSHTIPRELTLKTLGNQVTLCQTPVVELQSLRAGSSWSYTDITITELQQLIESDNITGNMLELRYTLEAVDTSASFGIKLLKDDTYETIVGLNRSEDQYVSYCDNTKGGQIFHPKFPDVYQADVTPGTSGQVDFHVYVDWSSVEVFAASGSAVFSLRVFPPTDPRRVEVFGSNFVIPVFQVYELSSIWTS